MSFLNEQCEGTLLKFIEETPLRVIMLSVYDKVSNVMLSRVKQVIKYQKDTVSSEFLSVSSGYKKLEDTLKPDSHYYDRVRYIGQIFAYDLFLG